MLGAFLLTVATPSIFADDGNQIFRTDRLTMVKPVVKKQREIEPIHVQRTDRIAFYKTELNKDTKRREVVRRSDRIVFSKGNY